jgi:hypothetical protein
VDDEALVELLNGVARGDAAALEGLLPAGCQEMRRLAAGYLRHERSDHTLQPTALAHEAHLRLVGGQHVQHEGRHHVLGVAARAMREILVDLGRPGRRRPAVGSASVGLVRASGVDAVFSIELVTAVGELPPAIARPMLLQNRPNPFNPATVIDFALARRAPPSARDAMPVTTTDAATT